LTLSPAVKRSAFHPRFYPIETIAEVIWPMNCLSEVMTLTRIAVASFSLVAGACLVNAAKGAEVSSAYSLIPAQLAMARPGTPIPPAAKKRLTAPVVPTKPDAGLTLDEQKRLGEIMNRMPPKERKRLEKAVKKMTPEQRAQLVTVVKRQLAKKGTASPAGSLRAPHG
jgi:hypothetical protein